MSHFPVNGGEGPPRLISFKHLQSLSFSHPVNEIQESIDTDQINANDVCYQIVILFHTYGLCWVSTSGLSLHHLNV